MRFEFVRTGEHGTSVKRACGALGVSRGGYYAFLNRPKSSRQIAHEALEPFVEDIFYANNRRYGRGGSSSSFARSASLRTARPCSA